MFIVQLLHVQRIHIMETVCIVFAWSLCCVHIYLRFYAKYHIRFHVHCRCMNLHGMYLYGFAWVCMGLHGFAWVCMGLHRFAWVCIGLHRFAWMSFEGFAWVHIHSPMLARIKCIHEFALVCTEHYTYLHMLVSISMLVYTLYICMSLLASECVCKCFCMLAWFYVHDLHMWALNVFAFSSK